MTSIRKKLILSILAVIFVVTVLLATVTYFSVREEMDEFYDENLKQVAHTIISTEPSGSTEPADHKGIGTKLRGEEKYLTQVYKIKRPPDFSGSRGVLTVLDGAAYSRERYGIPPPPRP